MESITSRKNPLCQQIRKLAASASFRQTQGAFLCDGWKLLEEALLWSRDVRTVVFAGRPDDLPALPETVRLVQVPEDVLASLAPSRTPQGVLTVCGMPDSPLPEALTGDRYLVLEGMQDPGNVGTLLRTAAAFQADGVLLLPGCADPYSPRAVRASMGAVFRERVYTCTPAALTALLHRSGIPLRGAALSPEALDIRTADLRCSAVAIGSEGRGLSPELLQQCQGTIRIPMDPRCESLNAAQAGTILLWEMWKCGQSESLPADVQMHGETGAGEMGEKTAAEQA